MSGCPGTERDGAKCRHLRGKRHHLDHDNAADGDQGLPAAHDDAQQPFAVAIRVAVFLAFPFACPLAFPLLPIL